MNKDDLKNKIKAREQKTSGFAALVQDTTKGVAGIVAEDADTDKEPNVSLQVRKSYRDRMKMLAAKKSTSIQELVQDAINMYLKLNE